MTLVRIDEGTFINLDEVEMVCVADEETVNVWYISGRCDTFIGGAAREITSVATRESRKSGYYKLGMGS